MRPKAPMPAGPSPLSRCQPTQQGPRRSELSAWPPSRQPERRAQEVRLGRRGVVGAPLREGVRLDVLAAAGEGVVPADGPHRGREDPAPLLAAGEAAELRVLDALCVAERGLQVAL